MHNSTRPNNLAVREELPRGIAMRNDTPAAVWRRESAGNDDACENSRIVSDDEPWAQHALAANGFGDATTTDAAFSPWLVSERLAGGARAHRAAALAGIMVAALRTVVAFARQAQRRYRQRLEAKAIYDALHQLDDHTLHDLGIDRSEISSVAAEATGQAQYTRAQAFQGITRRARLETGA